MTYMDFAGDMFFCLAKQPINGYRLANEYSQNVNGGRYNDNYQFLLEEERNVIGKNVFDFSNCCFGLIHKSCYVIKCLNC